MTRRDRSAVRMRRPSGGPGGSERCSRHRHPAAAQAGSCWHRSCWCPLLTYVAISQFTPRYTATGTLLYDASEYKLRELQSILRVDPITDAVMATQAEVLRGMPVVEQVASRLNLHTNPEFNVSLAAAVVVASVRCPTVGRDCVLRTRRRCAGRATCPGPRLDPARNATLQRRAGRADRDAGEGVACAGGLVHRGRPGDRRGRGQRCDGRLREGPAGREIRRRGQGAGSGWSSGAKNCATRCGDRRTRSPTTARRTAWSRACTRGSTASRSAC